MFQKVNVVQEGLGFTPFKLREINFYTYFKLLNSENLFLKLNDEVSAKVLCFDISQNILVSLSSDLDVKIPSEVNISYRL